MFSKSDTVNKIKDKNKNDTMKIIDKTDSLAGDVATARGRYFLWNKPVELNEERKLNTFLTKHKDITGLHDFANSSISYNQCIDFDMQHPPHNPSYFCANEINEYRRTRKACLRENEVEEMPSKKFGL